MHFMDARNRGDRVGAWELSRATLYRFAFLFALCLYLASTAPPGLVLATLGSLLLLGSGASVAMAALSGEWPLAEHLNNWDQAVALFALGILCNAFVDRAAVAELLAATTS